MIWSKQLNIIRPTLLNRLSTNVAPTYATLLRYSG